MLATICRAASCHAADTRNVDRLWAKLVWLLVPRTLAADLIWVVQRDMPLESHRACKVEKASIPLWWFAFVKAFPVMSARGRQAQVLPTVGVFLL